MDQHILHANDVSLDERFQETPGLQVKMPLVAEATAGRAGSPPPSREVTGSDDEPGSFDDGGSDSDPGSSDDEGSSRAVSETPHVPASSATSASLPPGDRSEDQNFECVTPQLPPGDDYNTSDEEEQKKEEKQEVDEEEHQEGMIVQEESAEREEVQEEQEDYEAMPPSQALGAFDPDVGPMIVPQPPPTAKEVATALARKRAREEAAARLAADRWETPAGLEQRRLEAEEDPKADVIPTHVSETRMSRKQGLKPEPQKERESAAASTMAEPSAGKDGSSIVISFRQPGGSIRRVDFGPRKPPIGVDFTKTTPVTVAQVPAGGHAAELGVQEGWQIHAIMDEVVLESESPSDVFHRLAAASAGVCGQATPLQQEANLQSTNQKFSTASRVRQRRASQASSTTGKATSSGPKATAETRSGLILTFRLPDGSQHEVPFGQRKPPMGMDLSRNTPLTILQVHPGTHAEELGLEMDWQIIKVNGNSALGKSHDEVFMMMHTACSS